MAIIFQKEKRKNKYLLRTLGIVIIIAVFLFLMEFFIRRNVVLFEESFVPKKVNLDIDFATLERVRSMKSFDKIEPFSGVASRRGRGNPFILYSLEEEPLIIDELIGF